MKKGQPTGRQGFTLLEILISVIILSTVSVLIAQVFFSITHVNTKAVLTQDIKQNGEFALETMMRSIRGAKTWYRSCDYGATSTDSAEILTSTGETITYACVSDGVAARIASVSAAGRIRYLTNNNLTLSDSNDVTCTDSNLIFSCPGSSMDAMNISFTLSQIGNTSVNYETVRQSFEGTVKPRSL